jgi:predicted transcriptional regulator
MKRTTLIFGIGITKEQIMDEEIPNTPKDIVEEYVERTRASVTHINAYKPTHPFAQFQPCIPNEPQAPEMVIDDLLIAGTAVVAGQRGLGKTSALVPLLLTATGLLKDWPLKATVRRKVVYVAEDVQQVQRIITALYSENYLSCERAELDEWFHLAEAERLSPEHIAQLGNDLDDLWVDNAKVDGSLHTAAPVICLDTTNATIAIEEGNNNSEISRHVATLRQGLRGFPMVLVGHVSKASRADTAQPTFIGAGAWENDTQQALYLVIEDDQRFLMMGKRRFEPLTTEYELQSHLSKTTAVDVLGNPVEMSCYFAVPAPTSKEERGAAKELAQEEARFATGLKRRSDVIRFISSNPGCNGTKIKDGVGGKNDIRQSAIKDLLEDGLITYEKSGKAHAYHLTEKGRANFKSGNF